MTASTFERFLALLDNHPRACLLYDPSHMLLQHVDYLGFISLYADRIRAFHVKDAEFRRSARTGVYGGYNGWLDRAGRFRSPGDGQVDFKSIFSSLTETGYRGWATLEWECCLKNAYDGAREGRAFIEAMLIHPPVDAFDKPLKGTLAQGDSDIILGI